MAEQFDAYHKWLGIPPEEQPPNLYRLLGIQPFEEDPEVVEAAVARQAAHVRTYQLGKHVAISQQLLSEIHVAKAWLTDPTRKAQYDAQLRAKLPSARTVARGDAEEEGLDPALASILASAEQAKRTAAHSALPRGSISVRWWIVGGAAAALTVLLALVLVGREPARSGGVASVPTSAPAKSEPAQPEVKPPATSVASPRRDEPTPPPVATPSAPEAVAESARPASAAAELTPPASPPAESKPAPSVEPPASSAPAMPVADPAPARPTENAAQPATVAASAAPPEPSPPVEAAKPVAKSVPKFEKAFDCRRLAGRKALLEALGGTEESERAVAAALNWFARHQNSDGSWSLTAFNRRCKDDTCTGVGSVNSDSAATAMALLPFLAAGQTHLSRGPHKHVAQTGLFWLLKTQRRDGSLWGNSPQKMYTHGLATLALCEAYGLTGDRMLRHAGQAAIDFIQNVQHPRTGGWRYNPGDEGDTSSVGWQVQALKSAQLAGLTVSPATVAGAKHWLSLCATGNSRGLFSYTPGSGPSASMTAAGLLLSQSFGMGTEEPPMREGVKYLMATMPDLKQRSLYYWYYASQVMRNVSGSDWERWNSQMRQILVDSQVKKGCAQGSWDPNLPTREAFGELGGRLYVTSLSTLVLEVYYRYPPPSADDN
jgi:hypothetical protein